MDDQRDSLNVGLPEKPQEIFTAWLWALFTLCFVVCAMTLMITATIRMAVFIWHWPPV